MTVGQRVAELISPGPDDSFVVREVVVTDPIADNGCAFTPLDAADNRFPVN